MSRFAVAMEAWLPLADSGDARAQTGVAAMYLGGHGVPQSYDRALFWYARAADQRDAAAQYMLATLYRDGRGVDKDVPRAASLLRNAADQGQPWAQYSLGLMYRMGEGVPQDNGEAFFWLSLATASSPREDANLAATASFVRDDVAARLTAAQLEEARQRIRDWKPAASGAPPATR